jgi:hypothetical protein
LQSPVAVPCCILSVQLADAGRRSGKHQGRAGNPGTPGCYVTCYVAVALDPVATRLLPGYIARRASEDATLHPVAMRIDGVHYIEQVRSKVTPGTSALFLFLGQVTTDRVVEAFKGAPKFEIIASNLSHEQEAKLKAEFAS